MEVFFPHTFFSRERASNRRGCLNQYDLPISCFSFQGENDGDNFSRKDQTNILVMAHNNGLPENIHFYEVVEGIQDQKKCKQVRTGPSIVKNVGELNQRSLKYFNDHKSVRQFPPTYYLEEDTTKKFVDMVDGFLWLTEVPIKILTNYNPVDHLTLLGLSDKDRNQIMSRTYETYDNVVLVIHPKEKWLVVNVVVDGADPKTLQLEMEKMNDILKTIYKTGYQKLKEHYMTLVGLIICPCLEDEDLNSKMFPFLNDNKPMFVTKNEWNNVELLENKFKLLVSKSKKEIKGFCQSGAIKRSSTGDIEMYTGQLMASMAQRSLFLPKVTDDMLEKIDTILLNEDQINTINHPCKWKIMVGGFGSGKTVVLNEIARQMIKQDDIGAICYLPFAPYSLIDKKFEESFHLLCKEEKIEHLAFKLQSISLQECLKKMNLPLSDVYDLTSSPKENVSLIMEHLRKKYCTDGKSIAILIDEFPREFIDKDYASRLTESLERHFEDITVAISFQSVEKVREFESNGKVTNSRQCSIDISGMKEFKLGKTMRMALDNYQLNEILKKEISRGKHVIPLKYDSSNSISITHSIEEILSSPKAIKSLEETHSSNIEEILSSPKAEKRRIESLEETHSSKNEEDTQDTGEPAVTEPTSSKSDTFRLQDLELLTKGTPEKGKVVQSMNTKCSFVETECGHTMCCSTKPKLHLFPSSLSSYESNVCLSLILENCIKDAEGKVVIICTSKEQVETMKMALDRIRKNRYNIYIPYLLGPLPSSEDKSKIVHASNYTDFVLITDYRSFRGCEAEKCVMVFDLNEDIGANIYVEILTRCVAYLDILVTPRNNENAPSNTSKVMDKVLKKWLGEDLVSKVHDIKLQINRNHFNVKITESGVTETLSREIRHKEEEEFKTRIEKPREVNDDTNTIE